MENQNNNSSSNGGGSPMLLNIIGNALASSQKNVPEIPGSQTRKCSNCGAARQDGTNLSTCDYCGFEFFKAHG